MVVVGQNVLTGLPFRARVGFQEQLPESDSQTARLRDNAMSLGTIVLIILVIALLGGFSGLAGGPFYGTGYYGGGGLGLILVIVLILVLLGKL